LTKHLLFLPIEMNDTGLKANGHELEVVTDGQVGGLARRRTRGRAVKKIDDKKWMVI
jgi:hypothetical protein